MESPFIFVAHRIQLDQLEEPVSIGDRLELARATDEQIVSLKEFLNGSGVYYHQVHEHGSVSIAEARGTMSVQVDRSKWNYWVVRYIGPQKEWLVHHEVICAALYLGAGLEAILFYAKEGTRLWLTQTAWNAYAHIGSADSIQFGPLERDLVGSAYDKLLALRTAKSPLWQNLRNFLATLQLPRHHPMYHLALFAVLESFITHDPHGSHDSLTHQVSTKMCLLERDFARPLDYSFADPGAGHLKAWKALYGYRSAIAHGGEFEFKAKFPKIKTLDELTPFLLSAVRSVAARAVNDPDTIKLLQAV